jgi:hypothetical protein
MRILAFDPGDHTGWVYYDGDLTSHNCIYGGTVVYNFSEIAAIIKGFQPNIIVYETFKLYAKAAPKLAGDQFYTCQVIGVIKYLAELEDRKYVNQDASCKQFSGTSADLIRNCSKSIAGWTNHTTDALYHVFYYLRNHK